MLGTFLPSESTPSGSAPSDPAKAAEATVISQIKDANKIAVGQKINR